MVDNSFTLSSALHAVASVTTAEPTLHAAHNLLGLSLLMTASPSISNVTRWPLYARDAFLIPTGRALGLTIRDIHPPEAAIGVDQAVEFRQHFDASYAPLIRRALEHRQMVLGWQGWEGKSEFLWGIITREDSRGIGFTGIPHPVDRLTDNGQHEQVIRRPPVQVYVVEQSSGPRADPDECAVLMMAHAVRSLDASLGARFGMLTGAPAYRRWAEVASVTDTAGQLALVGSLLSGIDCFRDGACAPIGRSSPIHPVAALLTGYALALENELRTIHDCLQVSAQTASAVEFAPVVAAIGRAAELTEQTLSALRAAAPQNT